MRQAIVGTCKTDAPRRLPSEPDHRPPMLPPRARHPHRAPACSPRLSTGAQATRLHVRTVVFRVACSVQAAEDVERLSHTSKSAVEFYNAMLQLYPERITSRQYCVAAMPR